MADTSTRSLTIDAAPDVIMGVIADFASYPEWTDAITDVEITEQGLAGRAARVRFRMDAGLIKDTYELAYTWPADGLSVAWELVSGQIQKSQHGSYVLRPVGDDRSPRTEVTYSLAVTLSIPLIGPLKRKAERVIMETALGELRRRVEALA